jgi:hypothetical protein
MPGNNGDGTQPNNDSDFEGGKDAHSSINSNNPKRHAPDESSDLELFHAPGCPHNRNSCWIDTSTVLLRYTLADQLPEFIAYFGGAQGNLRKAFLGILEQTMRPGCDWGKARDDFRTVLYDEHCMLRGEDWTKYDEQPIFVSVYKWA